MDNLQSFNDCSRGFHHSSAAWYAPSVPKPTDEEDRIEVGFYAADQSTAGEMTIRWIRLDDRLVPQLHVYSDGWRVLSHCQDLVDLLASLQDQDVSPLEMCEHLRSLGFTDRTARERTDRPAA